MADTVLTGEQVESFVEHGHVTLPGCFTREDAQPLLDEAWTGLGYDPRRPVDLGRAVDPHARPRRLDVGDLRAAGVEAVCDLVGGAERIPSEPYAWNDGFIVNLCEGADRPWGTPRRTRRAGTRTATSSGTSSTRPSRAC